MDSGSGRLFDELGPTLEGETDGEAGGNPRHQTTINSIVSAYPPSPTVERSGMVRLLAFWRSGTSLLEAGDAAGVADGCTLWWLPTGERGLRHQPPAALSPTRAVEVAQTVKAGTGYQRQFNKPRRRIKG